jgi:Transposase DDE domain
MSVRLHTTEVQRILQQMERQLAPLDGGGWVSIIDGKPLLVGSHSKDPDAQWGHVRRGFAKGYKLHAWFEASGSLRGWEIAPLNISEPEIAAVLIPAVKRGGGYILGDKAYDSNPLHDTALARGYQLVAPRKRPHAGLGHRRHSPGRLRCIELLTTSFGKALHHSRDAIERQFAWLTNHACGLSPLPNWVRRQHRVRLWVQAKLLIHSVYLLHHCHPPPLAVK